MTPYLISIFLLILACFVFNKTKWVSYLAIGFLFILSMFRAESVGLDTTAYIRMGDTYTPSGLRTLELIFLFVSTLKAQFGNSVVIYFFTIVTFISILLSCRRFKIKPTYAFFYFVLFLYFNLSLNIARQFAAASVLLYAYSFLNDKGRINLLYYVLLVLIACGIHISALIGFLIYPLKYFNVNKIKNTVLVAVIFVVYILISVIWSAYFVKWATSVYTDIYRRRGKCPWIAHLQPNQIS